MKNIMKMYKKARVLYKAKRRPLLFLALIATVCILAVAFFLVLALNNRNTICSIPSERVAEYSKAKEYSKAISQYDSNSRNCTNDKANIDGIDYKKKSEYIVIYNYLAKKAYATDHKGSAKSMANDAIFLFSSMTQEEKNASSTASIVSDLYRIKVGDY